MQEIWKDIEGFEGVYQISSKGNVRSLNRYVNCKGGVRIEIGKPIKPKLIGRGYHQVFLRNNGTHKQLLVHRLVAQAFLPNPDNLPEVNHIDENKTNNCIENLEWCDSTYNMRYTINKPVIQYTKDGYMLKVWDCAYDAYRETGIFNTSISSCCKGKVKSAGGSIWKYYTTDNYLIGKLNNSLMDKGITLRKAS